jgi:hypothetical protein
MKEVRLSQGKVAIVDDEDFESVNQFKWYAHRDGNTFYAYRCFRLNGVRHKVSMHQFIFGEVNVDHKNLDGLDNRRLNLRRATKSQNGMNRQKDSRLLSSKFKGVYWHTKAARWRAQIGSGQKSHEKQYLGSFKSEEEAARAYDEAAQRLFGEFAHLNFPERLKEGKQ